MQLRNYSKKSNVPIADLIEALKGQFGGVWLSTSKINPDIVSYLDKAFGTEQPDQTALPSGSKPPSLPAANNQTSAIAQTDKSNLTASNIPHDQLTTLDLIELQDTLQTQLIKETAEIRAIEHHQLATDTYDFTRRALLVADINSDIAVIKKKREVFKNSQSNRTTENSKPESKDYLQQYLSIWNDDSHLHSEKINQIIRGL